MKISNYIFFRKMIIPLFLTLIIGACGGFTKSARREDNANYLQKSYIEIVVNGDFDSLAKEDALTVGYCGKGGWVSCGKIGEPIFINGEGPYANIKKESYNFVNDGFPENEDKFRVQQLGFHYLQLSKDDIFLDRVWYSNQDNMEFGVIELSGKKFQFSIMATYDDKGFCHLVKSMASRIGANDEVWLTIKYSEDVSEKYFVKDWYRPDGMRVDQKAVLQEFKKNAENAFILRQSPKSSKKTR